MSLNAVPDEVVEVGTFNNPTETSYETPFLSSWDEIEHAKTLEVVYEEDGYLPSGTRPPEAEISRTHLVQMGPGQWLEGFEVTTGDPIESREDGPVGTVNVDVWV
ncbi:hypothetical protein EKO27_g8523, partial [Xylaria grammica]